ncbi:MAG: ArgR family transcriptional regulator [Bryobacteraceae bacterium]
MNKAYRQSQILKLIRMRAVHTQEELAKALRAVKVPATQVTLSRDIHELGLVKTPSGYAQVTMEPAPLRPDVAALAREILLDVKQAQNLLVLRTPPANANALAAALDRAEWAEIVGTVAGDDTVLVVTPDTKIAESLGVRLTKMLKA